MRPSGCDFERHHRRNKSDEIESNEKHIEKSVRHRVRINKFVYSYVYKVNQWIVFLLLFKPLRPKEFSSPLLMLNPIVYSILLIPYTYFYRAHTLSFLWTSFSWPVGLHWIILRIWFSNRKCFYSSKSISYQSVLVDLENRMIRVIYDSFLMFSSHTCSRTLWAAAFGNKITSNSVYIVFLINS